MTTTPVHPRPNKNGNSGGLLVLSIGQNLTLVEVMGVEPTTSSMRPKRSSQLSYTPRGCPPS